jgi:manganese transport protein
MIPALILIGVGFDPTRTLVLSQVFLSFGIPFALVPLLVFTSDSDIMGTLANRRPMMLIAGLVTAVVVGLNLYLLATVSS